MPKRPPSYRAVHGDADKIEPRVARAHERAAARILARLPMSAILDAIEAKDLATANRLIEETDVEDALEPTMSILRDAYKRGGKRGAEEVERWRR